MANDSVTHFNFAWENNYFGSAKWKELVSAIASGTKPFPEKFFSKALAKIIEQIEPANVVTVAHQIATL